MDTTKKRGRPPINPEDRLVQRTIRLKSTTWEKIDRLGLEWLRRLVEKAKDPKP